MTILSWLSWPVFATAGLLCAWVGWSEFGTYLGVGIMFIGLTCCCCAATSAGRLSLLRELALAMALLGVWACLGKLTFALLGK